MMESTTKQVVDYVFHGNVQPMVVYGQESCETIWVNKEKELRYLKAEKNMYLKTLSIRLFLNNGSRYNKRNTLLFKYSLEKNILYNTRNVVFFEVLEAYCEECLHQCLSNYGARTMAKEVAQRGIRANSPICEW